jgi:hypothetical protein
MNGFRVIARKDGERMRLYSRPGNDLQPKSQRREPDRDVPGAAIPVPMHRFRSVLGAGGSRFGGVKRAPRGNSMGQTGQRVRHG